MVEKLTERERQVAKLVATGKTNNGVAAELHVAPNTVKVHLRRIYRKLQIGSRVELAVRVTRGKGT